jgi:prevent-host-death family protein
MTKKTTDKTTKLHRQSGVRARRVRRNATGTHLANEDTKFASSLWKLHEAKARFAELVRRAKTQGPQHVTVYGREEVVVVSADEFNRLKGELTGQALVEVMQNAPLHDVDIEPQRSPMPVRDVVL